MIFFITLFRYFTIVLFFTLHFFSFSQGMQTRERAHCARSVFPFIKKKKKKKKKRFHEENSNVYTSLSIGFNVYNMPLLRMREDLRKIYSHRIYFVSHFLKQGDGELKSIYCIIFFSFSEF